jgi:type IV secretion system protein VirD4
MLNPFILRKSLSQVLSKSSFDITNLSNEKTAIYIIVPDEKNTLHFIVSMFIKQTYEILINSAQQQENGKLPIRMNFLLDEFANIPAIPEMSNMISAARSRNIRFYLMVQGMDQLRNKYKKDAQTIKGNCDNWIFLSSKEIELLEEISKICGSMIQPTVNPFPLISTTQLQKLKKDWEYSEALIKNGRLDPYVSCLPDIDQYKFHDCPPILLEKKILPKIIKYDLDKIIDDIKNDNRPIPFSFEVYGENKYFKKEKEATANETTDSIYDW